MQPTTKYFILLLITSICTACSTDTWLGEDNEVPIEGKRIAILKENTTLTPHSPLQSHTIKLPPPITNNFWNGSNSILSHLTLKTPLNYENSTSIGDGADSPYIPIAAPIIINDTIYTLDTEANVRAWNTKSLDEIWETTISKHNKNLIGGGLAFNNGTIFATVGNNSITALNAKNGTILWTKNINGLIRSAPVTYENNIIVNTIDNKTYTLNNKTGKILWTHEGIVEKTSVLGSANVVVNNNIAIIPHSSGEIYALNTKDGEELWSDSLAFQKISIANLADIDASPLIADNKIYASSQSGLLAAYDLYSGARLWEREIASSRTPWAVRDYVFVITNSAQLVAIHNSSGQIKWVKQLQHYKNPEKPNRIIHWSRPILANEKLWLTNSNGALNAYHIQDGELVESYKIPENVNTPPIVANNTLYILTKDAELIQMQHRP